MSTVATIVGLVTKPITDVVGKLIERRQAKDSLKNKAAMAKQSDSTNITLTDAEWEIANQENQGGTWKDEFVTLCIMYPFVGLFFGALWLALTEDPRILNGTMAAITALDGLGVNIGTLMEIVVYAAVGLKIWRKF